MKGKIISRILAFTMIFGCGSALAEVPNGTVVMDGKGYSLEYLNTHPKEFRLGNVKSLLIKLPNGKWADARSEKILDKSQIPEITYTDNDGDVQVYDKCDGEIIKGEITKKDSKVDLDEKEYKVIEVSNSVELSKAIGSNRKIILKKGMYNLGESDNEYIENSEISGVENLIIEGQKVQYKNGDIKHSVELSVNSKNPKDIFFVDCKNITLRNVSVIASKTVRGKSAPSIVIENSEDFRIENSILSESTMTLRIEDSKRVVLENSVLEKCSMMMMNLKNSSDILLKDCKFKNTVATMPIFLKDSYDVILENCEFTGINSSGFTPLININCEDKTDKKILKVIKCTFKDNKARKLFIDMVKNNIELKDNKFSGNSFD